MENVSGQMADVFLWKMEKGKWKMCFYGKCKRSNGECVFTWKMFFTYFLADILLLTSILYFTSFLLSTFASWLVASG